MSEAIDYRTRPNRYVSITPHVRGGWAGAFDVRLCIDGQEIPVCSRASMQEAEGRAIRLLGRFGTNPDFLVVEGW